MVEFLSTSAAIDRALEALGAEAFGSGYAPKDSKLSITYGALLEREKAAAERASSAAKADLTLKIRRARRLLRAMKALEFESYDPYEAVEDSGWGELVQAALEALK